MTPNDYEEFSLLLNGCCEAVGKPIMSKPGLDVFYLRLEKYDLELVKWAMISATEGCKSGFDYTANRVSAKAEEATKTNKFREAAMARLMQQDKTAKDLTEYLESDEYVKNQDYGSTFSDLRKLLNNV